ncbi:hypothetical protein AK812_SmicGene47986, partial [Symbiodinium microadriaticum]
MGPIEPPHGHSAKVQPTPRGIVTWHAEALDAAT